MEIAKIRCARNLWSTLAEAYGMPNSQISLKIHSTTSQWNLTIYDPHVNMLRGTTEAMSAVLGGADSLSVLPFDYAYGHTTEFSDRIARNVQIILREEAYLDRVADPAGGSYYVEFLTDSLGEKAWALFQEADSKGGYRKAFESGWIQGLVKESLTRKMDRVAAGQGRILGTNAFPLFNEIILKNVTSHQGSDTDNPYEALKPVRFAAPFEELRLETERSLKRPVVFLLKHGHPAWMTARASFSANFFACAGYEILDQPPFDKIEEGIEAARIAQADVVVMCSTDDAYAEIAPPVAKALKDKSLIVIAGNPVDSLDDLRREGIDHFIHIRSNHLESLARFNKILL
jgi:methylmalonyl-CoA mutase